MMPIVNCVSRRGLGVDTDNPSVECATLIHDPQRMTDYILIDSKK